MDNLSTLYGILKELELELGIDVHLKTGMNTQGDYYSQLNIGQVQIRVDAETKQESRRKLVRDFYEFAIKEMNNPFDYKL